MPKSPYWQGFETAEQRDPRGRRANELDPKSPEWLEWEHGYSDYGAAIAEMFEGIDDYYEPEGTEDEQ